MDDNQRKRGVAAFDLALVKAGGYQRLAEICDCRRQNLHNARQCNRPIPPKYVDKVSAALGILKSDLRPDLYEEASM